MLVVAICPGFQQITDGMDTGAFAYDIEEGSQRRRTYLGRYALQLNMLYDAASRIQDVTYPAKYGVTNNPRPVLHHDYDTASRVNNLTVDGAAYASSFNYNAASQLTSLNVGGTTNQWTQSYTYDRFGNRTGVTKTGTITYTDGLASLSFTDGAGKVRTNRITTAGYTYDEAGNLTRGQVEGASPGTSVWQLYQYDAAGRLACTKDDSSVLIADYSYGASNHRLKQTEYGSGGTTCYYAWDGNSIITEFSDTGSALSWTKSYVFLGGRLLATPTPGGTNYHHPDRLGTRLVTSETNGIVAAEQTTLPYGTALDIESMNTPTNRRFTSYDRSQKTKLDYAVNRFYNACQGRFTQVDPIGMQAADLEAPQTLNLYAYVGNDPINRIDPEGLGWLGKIFRFLAKIATAALVAVVLLTLPGWGVSIILLGIAGLTGLAGWHNGKAGSFARTILSLGFSTSPNFRTPGINPGSGISGVNRFLQQASSPDKFVAERFKKGFNEAFNEAIKRLDKDKCAKLFGGKEAAVATLQNTEYRVLTLEGGGPKLDPKTGNYGVIGAQTNSPTSVFINDKGPFFDQRLPLPEGGFKVFDLGTGRRGRDFGALLLLHELGHQTNVFLPDASDSKLNRSQTDKVLKACF